MESPIGSHEVACFNCKNVFDALEASWCSCLSKERSLVCSSCFNCFCNSNNAYKQKFWMQAPQVLWDRRTEEHRRDAPKTEPPSPDEIARPLILFVDDEPVIRSVAARAIESLGYGLIIATNGEEGLALAHEYHPDIVITDAMMPKMDGREMCRRIKASDEIGSTKVIIMTSLYTAPRYKYEAVREFKADDYLAKPIELNRLRELLQRHLG